MSSRPTIVMTEAEAALVVEAARLFVDPRTGEVPRVTVKVWNDELEAWWQAKGEAERFQTARVPKAARRGSPIPPSDPSLRQPNRGRS
jgi:hypothetical protein